MTVFCPGPKNMPEAKLKTNGLISLVEGISSQHIVSCMALLLLITLMQVSTMKRSNREKNANVQFEEERDIYRKSMELRAAAKTGVE